MQVIAACCLKHQAIDAIKRRQRSPADHPACQCTQATCIGFAVYLIIKELRHPRSCIRESQTRTNAEIQGRAVGGSNDKASMPAFRQDERRRVSLLVECRTHRPARGVEALATQPVQRPIRKPQ